MFYIVSYRDHIKTLKLSILYDIVNTFEISKSTVENHLHWLCYISHFDVWFPCKWQKIPLDNSDLLLKCHENMLLLKQIVAVNEKWILYNNLKFKNLWQTWKTTANCMKDQPSSKKIKYNWCSLYGGIGNVFQYELLENQASDLNKYYFQLYQLKVAVDAKHGELVYRKNKLCHLKGKISIL